MTNIVPRFAFYVALALSSLLALLLLSAAGNFGFGQVLAAGPIAVAVVAVMLLNPFVFGFLGFIKGTPRWQLIAAGAMLTLLVLYALSGFFGPIDV